MSKLKLGIFASGAAGGFLATGGTFTVDANGYRHHIFNSSGTLTVLGGEKQAFVLTQDGGSNGTNGDAGFEEGWPSYVTFGKGDGGSSGLAQYRQGTLSSDITITVGGPASASSISGMSLSNWQSQYQANGGQGGIIYYDDFEFSATIVQNGENGESGIIHSDRSLIYASVSNMQNQSGGGGGGGKAIALGMEETTTGTGGNAGGGNGASTQINGANGAANTGGGGGGGAALLDTGYPEWETLGGSGGSGYVVISYAL